MIPASVYRVAAGVTALVCFASLLLDLATWMFPDLMPSEAVHCTTAALGVVMAPLFAMQALIGADLACRKLHPLLLGKSRRMCVIGFVGSTIAVPLSLGRLCLGALGSEAVGTRALITAVMGLNYITILILVAANAVDGFRFRAFQRHQAR